MTLREIVSFKQRNGKNHMKISEKNSVELIEYTKAQDALNCVTHALGALLGAVVLVLLTEKAAPFGMARYTASAIIYGLSLIVLYSASAVYHGLPQGEAKRTARLVDHSVIPILLAGTATPCALITLYNHNKICCAVVLLLGWGSVIFGLVAKLFFFQKTKAACVAVYIIAGAVMLSCSLAVVDEINVHALLLLVLGCAVYLFGSIFCALGRKHPWCHVPFHMFMVAGSMIHAYVIYEYVFVNV